MPNTFKISEVLTIIRKKLHLSREQGLIIFAQGRYLMKGEAPLTDVYEKYHDQQDGFLYIVFAEENTYGANI